MGRRTEKNITFEAFTVPALQKIAAP